MTNLIRICTLCVSMLLTSGLCSAQADDQSADAQLTDGSALRVHSLFQSNMVIQREKPVDVWGWSKPGEKTTVSFAGNTASGTAGEDGKWTATLPALQANATPATMTIKDTDDTVTLENVVVGDVWVLGGQSNMAWGIGGTDGGHLEVASANFPNIRLLTVPKFYGREPKQNFPNAAELSRQAGEEKTDGSWYVCAPESIESMSAIGYVMARRIHMASQVPIGIVNTSRGGTTVEAWTPIARMRQLEAPEVKAMLTDYDEKVAAYSPEADLQQQIDKFEAKVAQMKKEGKDTSGMKRPTEPGPGPWGTHKTVGSCYRAVIAPLAGFAVKGTIFHQGYNNCFGGVEGARMYRTVFPELIRAWRAAFNDAAMPFLIISQCTAGRPQTLDDFLPHMADIGARIREAQYQTFLEFREAGDENVGFVSTYDLRHTSYHPRVKIPAGERAAAWALGTYYGMEEYFFTTPPMLEKMEVVDGAIELTYDTNLMGSRAGTEMAGFAIAGDDMKFQPAEVSHKVIGGQGRNVQTDKRVLVLTSPLVSKPVHYRYAWGRNPMGDVQAYFRFGGTEVMLPTQRSDDWTNGDLLKALTGMEADNLANLDRGETRALQRALAEEDQRRRVAEAKAILAQE